MTAGYENLKKILHFCAILSEFVQVVYKSHSRAAIFFDFKMLACRRFSNPQHTKSIADRSQIFTTDFTTVNVAGLKSMVKSQQNLHVIHENFAVDSW